MTHDELLDKITNRTESEDCWMALRKVVELHKPNLIPDWVPTKEKFMCWCAHIYPCPTIRAIESTLL